MERLTERHYHADDHYHMDFDTFTDLVKHRRIRPVSEEALRERREES